MITITREKGQSDHDFLIKIHDKLIIHDRFISSNNRTILESWGNLEVKLLSEDIGIEVKLIMENGDIEEFSLDGITTSPKGIYDSNTLTIDIPDIHVTDNILREIFTIPLKKVKTIKIYY